MARQKYVPKPEVVEAEQVDRDQNLVAPDGQVVRVNRSEFAVFYPGGGVEAVTKEEFGRRFRPALKRESNSREEA